MRYRAILFALKRQRFPDRDPATVTLLELQRIAAIERRRQDAINERIAAGLPVHDPILEAEGHARRV